MPSKLTRKHPELRVKLEQIIFNYKIGVQMRAHFYSRTTRTSISIPFALPWLLIK